MGQNLTYFSGTRNDLIELVPSEAAHFLEVGCGTGMTAEALRKARGAGTRIVGIEMSPEAAELARPRLDDLVVGDVESMALPFREGSFDCIIYGDLLEHLRDPWRLLKDQCRYLKNGGTVVASIPNICHYDIIKMLMKKRWDYQDAGILDRSHLRFFTLKGIKDLFKGAGLTISVVKREMRASTLKRLANKVLFGALSDYLTERYLLVAKK